MDRHKKGIWYGIIASISWGTIWPLSKYILEVYPAVSPFYISFLRFFSAAAAMFVIFLIKKDKAAFTTLKKHWGLSLLLAFFGIFGMGCLVFFSIKYTSTINSALLMNSNTLFIILFSVFNGEKITRVKASGAVLGFSGCYLIINNGFSFNFFSSSTLFGDLLALGAAVCWAVYTVIGRAKVKEVDATHLSAFNFFFGSVMILALTAFLGVPPTDLFKPVPFIGIVFMGLIPTAYGFTIWYYALEHVEAGTLGLFQFIVPFMTAVIGIIFFHEKFTFYTFLGMAAILAGIYISGKSAGIKPAGD